MTESEAIAFIDVMESATRRFKEFDYEQITEAANMAKEVLEKQIPKKPVEDKYHHMCCPNCNYTLLIHRDSEPDLYVPYCENCGQKILWQDVPFAYKDNFEELEELTDKYLERSKKK